MKGEKVHSREVDTMKFNTQCWGVFGHGRCYIRGPAKEPRALPRNARIIQRREKIGHIPTREYQLPESRNNTSALPFSQCVEPRGRPRARAAAEALRRSTSATANPTAAVQGIGGGGINPELFPFILSWMSSLTYNSPQTHLPSPPKKTAPRLGATLDSGGRRKTPTPTSWEL